MTRGQDPGDWKPGKKTEGPSDDDGQTESADYGARGWDLVPPVIPGYNIGKLLGTGGMGAVWEARQISLDRMVALKVMRADVGLSSAAKRFQQEMDLAASLSHPGIAQVYEGGEANGLLYYTMELVAEGRSLESRLGELESDLNARVDLLRDVCEAVGFAHENGVMHRDLKPSNILVTPDGKIKVVDFGLAKSLNPEQSMGLSIAGEVKGTPAYMSPEQARGESDQGPSSDVFSLGSMIFAAVSGELPWRTDGDSLSFGEQIQHREAKDLRALVPGIPTDLRAIIEKAMEKSPAHRYEHAGHLAADLRAFLNHEPISFRAKAPTYVAAKWMRRHRSRLARSTVVVALVSLVLALLFSLGLFSLLYEPGRKIVLETPPETLDLGKGASIQFQPVPDTEGTHIMSDPVSADAWLAASLAMPGNVDESGAHPVRDLSAVQAEWFCDWLNARYAGPEGSAFRLPTDKELESAMDLEGSGVEWTTFIEDGELHHAIRTGATANLGLSQPQGGPRLLWREFPDTIWDGVKFRVAYGPKAKASEVPRGRGKKKPAPDLQTKTLTLPLGRSETLHLNRVEPGGFLTRGIEIRVEITKPFWMATTETTRGHYEAVMGKRLSSGLGAIYPANSLGRAEAFAFCKVANKRLRASNLLPDRYELRLPTSSEWEYVCSEGSSLPFAPMIKEEKERTGSLVKYANANEVANQPSVLRAVANYKPTTWGFYDLNGNVAEWVYDDFATERHNGVKRFLPEKAPYYDPVRILGRAKKLNLVHILRGGHWESNVGQCSCGRQTRSDDEVDVSTGFRCVVGLEIKYLNHLGNTN